jgi:hypothetical protein
MNRAVIKIPEGFFLFEQRAESSPLFVNLDIKSPSYGWVYYVNGTNLVTARKMSATELSTICIYEYQRQIAYIDPVYGAIYKDDLPEVGVSI